MSPNKVFTKFPVYTQQQSPLGSPLPPHTVSKAPRPNGANNYRFRRSSLIRLALLRHPCLSHVICANGFRRHRGGSRCNSAIIMLFDIAYISADIRLFSKHRRDCDLPSQGWRGRAYRDVLAASHSIACAKGAPQVMGYI